MFATGSAVQVYGTSSALDDEMSDLRLQRKTPIPSMLYGAHRLSSSLGIGAAGLLMKTWTALAVKTEEPTAGRGTR